MKLALLGATGQVGREIAAIARADGVDIATLSRGDADLLVPGAAAAAIMRLRPSIIINAAAWTAVDKAESEPDRAFRVNASAVAEIAAAAAETGARLIHLSTDYVFAGDADRPLAEDAPVGPLNVYGASKLEGERLALAADPGCVILRTSWVYAPHGQNFVRTMLRLSQTRSDAQIVSDQIGGPTPAASIAAAALAVAARRGGAVGIFHFQGAPAASWAEFAAAVFAAAGRRVEIRRITSAEFPSAARRPLRAILDCSRIKREYGIEQPDWRVDLPSTVARLIAAGA